MTNDITPDRRAHAWHLSAGVVLIAVGTLLFAAQTWGTSWEMSRFWPLFMFIPGLTYLLAPSGQRSWPHAVFWMGMGSIFLLQSLRIAPVSQTWPLFLVLWGVMVMTGERRPWRGWRHRCRRRESPYAQ